MLAVRDFEPSFWKQTFAALRTKVLIAREAVIRWVGNE